MITYKAELVDASSVVLLSATNTETLMFVLNDLCSGITISEATWQSPYPYFYDGHPHTMDGSLGGDPLEYGANVFSSSEANCPITLYTCNEIDAGGNLGATCGYTSASGETILSFDDTTATLNFQSSDVVDLKYPPGTYTLRITAIAGTNDAVR